METEGRKTCGYETGCKMKIKYRDFEDFLAYYHAEHNPTVLDDDMPDDFDRFLANMDVEDWISVGNLYAEAVKNEV